MKLTDKHLDLLAAVAAVAILSIGIFALAWAAVIFIRWEFFWPISEAWRAVALLIVTFISAVAVKAYDRW